MFDFVLALKQASGHTQSPDLQTTQELHATLRQKLFVSDQQQQAAASVSQTLQKVSFGLVVHGTDLSDHKSSCCTFETGSSS